jgi:hypothetical protein
MPEDYYVRTSLDFGTEVPVQVNQVLEAMAEEVDLVDADTGLTGRWERVPGSGGRA